jgi:probable DNA metabolism protein
VTRHLVRLRPGADLDGFRVAVRALIAAGVHPDDVVFDGESAPTLHGAHASDASLAEGAARVLLPRAVQEIIEQVVQHRDPERYALLYRLVWRVLHGERHLLEVASDPLAHRLGRMAKAVGREVHKMHAFVRFRAVPVEDERFAAWFEPGHFILEAAAPFFVARFPSFAWSIFTPQGSAHWDGAQLTFGPAARREDAPDGDAFEDRWRGYYESTFNPARTNPELMRAHMPKRYWRNLPEAQAIPDLVRSAGSRVDMMIEQEATMPAKRRPDAAIEAMKDAGPKTLKELNAIIARSEPLVPGATQAVLGEGPARARVVFVGEQPGDMEDRKGRPFVGPAGQLLDRALAEAGIDRKQVYLTNAVKHFKFEPRGTRRIHSKPTASDVSHYRPWLQKELEIIAPSLVVALGATAILALTGNAGSITRMRGPAQFGPWPGYVTVHPSYLLRIPEPEKKHEAYDAFVIDLARIRELAYVARDDAPISSPRSERPISAA